MQTQAFAAVAMNVITLQIVLCTIPTSIFHETKANAVTDLLNNDDDNNPHENE